MVAVSGLAMLSIFLADTSAQTVGVLDTYVGGEAGYGRAMSGVQTTVSGSGYFAASSVTAINDIGELDLEGNGFAGGGFAGLDFLEAGSVVVGAEASFTFLTNEEAAVNTVTYPCCAPTEFTLTQTAKPQWLLTVRPRVGVPVGQAFVYATGGWALAGTASEETFTDDFASANQSAAIDPVHGWTYGGGVEITLFGPVSVRGEFLHNTFDASVESTNLTTTGSTWPDRIFTHSTDLSFSTVRGGVKFSF
jgi:outer membrane immunogenic protein